jgi:hypothetical protein
VKKRTNNLIEKVGNVLLMLPTHVEVIQCFHASTGLLLSEHSWSEALEFKNHVADDPGCMCFHKCARLHTA